MRRQFKSLGLLAIMLFGVVAPAISKSKSVFNLREFSLSSGVAYESNIFLELGISKPDWIANWGGQIEGEFRLGKSLDLITGLSFRSFHYQNYRVASYPSFAGLIELRSGKHRLQLNWSSAPGRLLYVGPALEEIVYNSRVLEGIYRVSLSTSLTLRFEYAWEKQNYGLTAPGRDMVGQTVGTRLYIKVSPVVSPQLGFTWTHEGAQDINYTFNKPEVMAATSFSWPSGLRFFLRYRLAWRDYLTDVPTDSNFIRNDQHHNILAELRIPIFKHLAVIFRDIYKKKISTRPDMNFTDNIIASELVFVF